MNRLMQLLGTTLFLASLSSVSATQVTAVNESIALAEATDEHVVWQRAPIRISLPVGQERLVSFPSQVEFGYNAQLLPPSVLRVENDNQTLYLLAKQPFATQRVHAKLATGEVILLDMNAQAQADDHPIDIVLPKTSRAVNFAPSGDDKTNPVRINYVTLTRYAIQQLYAPPRLLNHVSIITRFPLGTAHLAPLFYDGSALAMPLASWRGGDDYVTALWIQNRLDQPLRLDPRLLCGEWQAASFYPRITLAPRGTSFNRDASTLFVVSNVPFAQAIQSCLNGE